MAAKQKPSITMDAHGNTHTIHTKSNHSFLSRHVCANYSTWFVQETVVIELCVLHVDVFLIQENSISIDFEWK